MLELPSAARAIVAVLLVGNGLITAHELGHYLVARLLGVQVHRFTIGIGPALLQVVDRRATTWRLCLLPVGGFVGFKGERESQGAGSYAGTPPLVRLAIVIAGPAANVVASIGIFAFLLSLVGVPVVLPTVSAVIAGSAAERAGFRTGDRMLSMDGTTVATFSDVRPILQSHPDQTINVTVVRASKVIRLSPRLGGTMRDGRRIGLLGITATNVTRRTVAPIDALAQAAVMTWSAIADSVVGLFHLATQGKGTENVAGLVGIAQLTGNVAAQGVGPLLALAAILSANLALMNLVPIPVLDGGVMVFCLVEMVLRRPLSDRAQEFFTRGGVALLATLFMTTTLHDLDQIGVFRWIAGL